MRRLLVPAIALLILSALPADARAEAPTERLRAFFGGAARALDPRATLEPDERLGTIRAMVRDLVDFREAAKLSLGPAWHARTAGERDEFVGLFSGLLEQSLIWGIAGRIRLSDGVRVSYLGESVEGAAATVWTTIAGKTGQELPFTYRMIERAGRWTIRDVAIDGVSLAANYRAQFTRVIGAASYRGLVEQMRARLTDAPGAPLVAAADTAVGSTVADAAPVVVASAEPDARAAAPSADPAPDAEPRSLALELTLVARAEVQPAAATTPAAGAEALARPAEATAPAGAAERMAPAVVALAAPKPPARAAIAPSAPIAVRLVDARGSAPAATRAPEPRAARPTVARPAAKAYWVQVGAFASAETAWRLAETLVEREPQSAAPAGVMVDRVSAPGSAAPVARVRVGPFPDRRAATVKLREIEAHGHQPFITDPRD